MAKIISLRNMDIICFENSIFSIEYSYFLTVQIKTILRREIELSISRVLQGQTLPFGGGSCDITDINEDIWR